MQLVHCERCHYSFEASDTEEAPRCRSCDGPTQPATPQPQFESSKTQKMKTVDPNQK
jgi:hypothetical protein